MSNHFNSYSAGLFNSNFQLIEVVSRYSDTQLQVTENFLISQCLIPTYISVSKFKTYLI